MTSWSVNRRWGHKTHRTGRHPREEGDDENVLYVRLGGDEMRRARRRSPRVRFTVRKKEHASHYDRFDKRRLEECIIV